MTSVEMLALLAWVLLSRLLLDMAGLAPSADVILDHWQNLDIVQLSEHPFRSLWLLHAQPPLWNALLAFFSHMHGGNHAQIVSGIHFVFIAISMANSILLFKSLLALGVNRTLSLFGAGIFIALPSTIYYENYIFYPHLTSFFICLMIWSLSNLINSGKLIHLFFFMLSLFLFSWTWAVVHPAVVLLMGLLALPLVTGSARLRSAALVVAFVAASSLPTIKNACLFDLPSASSWVGLNLSQTTPWPSAAQRDACSFERAFDNARAWRHAAGARPREAVLYAPAKASGHPNANHLAVKELSRDCLRPSLTSILGNMDEYAKDRMDRLVSSHRNPSFFYFSDPEGWETFAFLDGFFGRDSPWGYALAAVFLVLFLNLARLSARGERRHAWGLMLAFVAFFTFATHAVNGAEQERMRYTIEPIYFVSFMTLLQRLVARPRGDAAASGR